MFSPGLLGQTGPGGTHDWGTLGMGYTGPTGDRGDTGPRGDTVSHSLYEPLLAELTGLRLFTPNSPILG